MGKVYTADNLQIRSYTYTPQREFNHIGDGNYVKETSIQDA